MMMACHHERGESLMTSELFVFEIQNKDEMRWLMCDCALIVFLVVAMLRVCHTAGRQSRLRQLTPEEETTRAVQQSHGLAIFEHPKMKSLLLGSTPARRARLSRRPRSNQGPANSTSQE